MGLASLTWCAEPQNNLNTIYDGPALHTRGQARKRKLTVTFPPAKEAVHQTSLISPVLRSLNAVDVNSGLSGRVVSEKAKGNKLEQRLQRARSSKKLLGGGIKGSLVDPWMNEVGVKIYPC